MSSTPAYMKEYRRTNAGKISKNRSKYHLGHKDAARDSQYRRNYGISLETYNMMLANQNGACKICKRTPSMESRTQMTLQVDHAHVVGYASLSDEDKAKHVRGLLCNNCNGGLGLLEDRPDLLRAALDYLDPDERPLGF